jgi:Outer membrane protein beta-barrel domain
MGVWTPSTAVPASKTNGQSDLAAGGFTDKNLSSCASGLSDSFGTPVADAYTSPSRGMSMLQRSFLLAVVAIVVAAALPAAHAQDYNRFLINVGGGMGYPQGDLNSFVNSSGSFVAGGGYNLTRYLGVDTEYFWQDLPVNDRFKQVLREPNVRARQYAWTFNGIARVPIRGKFGAYVIGGIGWYHRSGEATTPSVGVICDPYWSWWYGCVIGTSDIVTKSKSSNAFGENIGVGFTYRWGESQLKVYTEVRYHHASYNNVSTQLVPVTIGIRW